MGVNSRPLGEGRIDESGPNAGFYERATAAEICDYYRRVLDDNLLPTGRVTFLSMSEYAGRGADGHRIVSRLTGAETTVRVRKKLVDATYVETSVPATHTPSFEVDHDARLIPPGALINIDQPPEGYTILGAGKTAMDTCTWLLDNGVDPDAIRWIKPREAWVLDRAFFQPLELVTSLYEGLAIDLESAASATGIADLFDRLESAGQLYRIDSQVEPTMYCAAILSHGERESLRQIENVVRLGRVKRLGSNSIDLEQGSIPTGRGQVHVDCSASGTRPRSPRPIFEPDRITLQGVRSGNTCFNGALIGYVESSRDNNADKNALCPPNPYPNHALDWIGNNFVMWSASAAWTRQPDLQEWLERSRLNVGRGVAKHMGDPRMQSAIGRLMANLQPALANLQRLQSEAQSPVEARA
jgi:hypothetical protein